MRIPGINTGSGWCLRSRVTILFPFSFIQDSPDLYLTSWHNYYTGTLVLVAEAPTLWPSDAKKWLIRKEPDAGKDWRQEEKGTTDDGMVGWHHRLDGHEFKQAPGVGDGQGGLACCSPWVTKSWIWLNWTEQSLMNTLLVYMHVSFAEHFPTPRDCTLCSSL